MVCQLQLLVRPFRTHQLRIHLYLIPDWSFGIQEQNLQLTIDNARSQGAQVVVLLSHNGMDVDIKLASRVTGATNLGGHTHDGVPAPVLVDNAAGRLSHQCR